MSTIRRPHHRAGSRPPHRSRGARSSAPAAGAYRPPSTPAPSRGPDLPSLPDPQSWLVWDGTQTWTSGYIGSLEFRVDPSAALVKVGCGCAHPSPPARRYAGGPGCGIRDVRRHRQRGRSARPDSKPSPMSTCNIDLLARTGARLGRLRHPGRLLAHRARTDLLWCSTTSRPGRWANSRCSCHPPVPRPDLSKPTRLSGAELLPGVAHQLGPTGGEAVRFESWV